MKNLFRILLDASGYRLSSLMIKKRADLMELSLINDCIHLIASRSNLGK